MAAAKETNLERNLVDLAKLQKGKQLVVINRDNVFEDLVNILQKPNMERSRLEVKFVYQEWTEPASDTGGPSKELFTIFFSECMTPQRGMFTGEGDELFPVDNHEALNNRWFYCLGRAIVLSLVQLGAGFPYLAPCCYSQIVAIEDVPKHDNMTLLLQKLNRAQAGQTKSECDILRIFEDCEISLLLKAMGIAERSTTTSENRKHVQNFLRIQRGREALMQMRAGLRTLGFLDKIRNCGQDVERFLVHTDQYSVDSAFMQRQLLDPLVELKTSSEGQVQVKQWAGMCLAELSDEQAVNLLEFITGMRSLPPGDFDIMVDFNAQNLSDKLPRAATCASLLLLPQGNENVKEFIRSFQVALECRHSFGRI